jgi:hypothetical protein
MNIDFYLLSAARRAHRLRPGRTYVFGREEGVDIVLQDALASRRHAELRWQEAGHWLVADLNSRNGVLINGTRMTVPLRMNDGDTLQIGGQVYRLYLLPPGSDPSLLGNQAPQISNLETMAPGVNMADALQSSAAYSGVVTTGGVLELLQFFQGTAKSGRLDLIDDTSVSSIWLMQGQPLHAECGTSEGIDALVSLAADPPRRFSFFADMPPPPRRPLQGTANGILMEVARMLDEQSK